MITKGEVDSSLRVNSRCVEDRDRYVGLRNEKRELRAADDQPLGPSSTSRSMICSEGAPESESLMIPLHSSP
jgi:hypothetical protein